MADFGGGLNRASLIVPEWSAPESVKTLVSTRVGGVSQGRYGSLNLGDHVGDDPLAVEQNRRLFSRGLPSEPKWLTQVHGKTVVQVEHADVAPEADAAVAHGVGEVCVIMTADCLPVLLCDDNGSVVGAAHAGWRGLAAGVLEETVKAMACPAQAIQAWLGPAIGPAAFEVGDEVREAFIGTHASAAQAFAVRGPGKWLADIYLLATQQLERLGVRHVSGGGYCTYSDPARFFSYRRDGTTGRMAACIWLEGR